MGREVVIGAAFAAAIILGAIISDFMRIRRQRDRRRGDVDPRRSRR